MARDGKVNYADGTKVCRRCKQKLPVSEFKWLRDRRLKAGGTYRPMCVACDRKANFVGVGLIHEGNTKLTDFGLAHENSIVGRMGPDRTMARKLALSRIEDEHDELAFIRWAGNDCESGYEVLAA